MRLYSYLTHQCINRAPVIRWKTQPKSESNGPGEEFGEEVADPRFGQALWQLEAPWLQTPSFQRPHGSSYLQHPPAVLILTHDLNRSSVPRRVRSVRSKQKFSSNKGGVEIVGPHISRQVGMCPCFLGCTTWMELRTLT